jgi:hypothetical protein
MLAKGENDATMRAKQRQFKPFAPGLIILDFFRFSDEESL